MNATFVILFHGEPTASALDLATAQAHALAERTAPAAAELYENRWTEHTPGEWRLMTRNRDRGGRWSWTQRAVRAVPLIQAEGTGDTAEPPADRAAILREAADAVWAMDYEQDANDYGFDSIRDAWDGGTMDASKYLRRMADEAQQATPAVTEEPTR
ncbi:hypothetical protein [Streptomyces sp. NPDC088775]|uniref:hypothetical protein n=1 Tax=Streptomyces sp. NPDC088775 TaxID=3365896 RepID=UPI00380408F7